MNCKDQALGKNLILNKVFENNFAQIRNYTLLKHTITGVGRKISMGVNGKAKPPSIVSVAG